MAVDKNNKPNKQPNAFDELQQKAKELVDSLLKEKGEDKKADKEETQQQGSEADDKKYTAFEYDRSPFKAGQPKRMDKVARHSFDVEKQVTKHQNRLSKDRMPRMYDESLKRLAKTNLTSQFAFDLRAQAVWNEYAKDIYPWLIKNKRVGEVKTNTSWGQLVDGNDITLTPVGLLDEQGNRHRFKMLCVDPKNQLAYIMKPTRNFSVEIISGVKKGVTSTGWFIDGNKKTSIYAVQYVRTISQSLQERVMQAVREAFLVSEESLSIFTMKKLKQLIERKDILVMETVFVDRWKLYDEFLAHGYDYEELMDAAKTIRKNAKMHDQKIALYGFDARHVSIYYTTDENPKSGLFEKPVNVIINVRDDDPWVVGHYYITYDVETGQKEITEVKPFSPNWAEVPDTPPKLKKTDKPAPKITELYSSYTQQRKRKN